MSLDLMIYDIGLGSSRLATTDDFSAQRPLLALTSVAAITVTNSAQSLAALMASSGSSIGSTCNWLHMQIRDDQTAANVVKINETAAASATAYDASMSRDTARPDPVELLGKGSKTAFDAFSLIATASTVVLVRQYREG